MTMNLVKIWPDELVQFKDEDCQEIRVFPIRNPYRNAGVAISLGDGAERAKYFRKLDGKWQSQDGNYNWHDIASFEGRDSQLLSWLDGLENAWMNAIMMAP